MYRRNLIHGAKSGYEVQYKALYRPKQTNKQAGHLSGCAVPVQMTHHQTKIVASGMHQVTFGNFVHTTKCHAGQVAAAFEEGEASLHQPGPEAAQTLSLIATGTAAIGVEFAAGVRIAMPATTLGRIALRDVGCDPLVTVERFDQLGLVVSFVRHSAENFRGLVSEAGKVLVSGIQGHLHA